MDNRHQQYLPGPPPPPNNSQGNMSYLPPPPPRQQMGQMGNNMLPPPPGYPPGTVYGLPGGWNQSYSRPGLGSFPPPPPMSMNQNQQYGMPYGSVRVSNKVPPPPPRDESLVSATFVPAGNSFGPGVGIPALDDFSNFSLDGYDPGAYADHNAQNNSVYNNGSSAHSARSVSGTSDVGTRETRAASATSQRPKFAHLRESAEPVSPGPQTATFMKSNVSGRPRAQSAMVPQQTSSDLANLWPLERILIWLAANSFSNEWQETFRKLHLEKADFLDLGRSGDKRSNLSRMHSYIYPQLNKECQANNTDAKRERRDGERLQRLVAGILQGGDVATSASVGHRRRESGLQSASADSTVENSPHPGNSTTPSSSGPEGSPATSHFGPGFAQRNLQERSSTLPVFSKQSSTSSTPAEPRHAESFSGPTIRGDYTRTVMNGVGARGRHSPNLSSDISSIAMRQDGSPGQSPALGHSMPLQAQSNPNLPSQVREPAKAQSADSFQKATGFTRNGGSGNIVTTELPYSGRFYEGRQDARPESQRANSNDPEQKEHNKGFFSKLMRGKKHDLVEAAIDESMPTSPRDILAKLPFTKQHGNHSDTALAQRPPSVNFLEGEKGSETVPKRQPRRYILVTPDYWNYRLIDVTSIESANSLREKIGHELGVDDMAYAQIYVTEPGKMEHEEPLTDAMLAAARSGADSSANLKFFVRSPTLSAGSAPHTDPLYSASSRTERNSLGKYPAAMSHDDLRIASEAYREETEKKRQAYLENRSAKRGQNTDSGTPVFDFDHPSPSPRGAFDDKKPDGELVPHRKPPTAPSASHMLTKVNSLRMTSQHKSRSSVDSYKRTSDILHEDGSAKGKRAFDPSSGIGSAIANSSKIAALPATATAQNSPRKVTIGNNNDDGDTIRPRTAPRRRDTAESSPQVGNATDHMLRPDLGRKKSYGADLSFRETNVAFAASPNPQSKQDDSDDDSDDGLFAIPMRGKLDTPKKTEQRPALTVDTDQPPGNRRKSVAFEVPNSNDGTSAGPSTTGDDSAGTGASAGYDQRSLSGDSANWGPGSPEDGRIRPNSFVSDIWANRPDVEKVVEDLDKFFPGVDLDKPFMEESGESSPMLPSERKPREEITARLGGKVTFGTEGLPLDFEKRKSDSDTLGSEESTLKASDRGQIVNAAKRQISKSTGLGRMKSIREVAQKRNDVQRQPSVNYRAAAAAPAAAVLPPSNNLLRRKSTKMFGANIVQIKAGRGARRSVLDPIPQEDVPTGDTPKRQATFKIIRGELIGKGTYGRVYLGMNATTGEFLAVKQVDVNPKAAAQERERIKEMVKALDQEIKTMEHLEHPNIVTYLGFDRQELSMCIYLEYISGGSVGSCLRKHGRFEESVVRSLTYQTLSGLAYLHEQGILHRDLKADNILLDLDGTCKISDFGISKKSDNIYGNDVTNSMQGSVFWMAPEVVRTDGSGYSAKVDIWSLGCVVLEMFAGKRPWSREEAVGAIFKLGNLRQAPPIPEDVSSTASYHGLNFMYDCFQIDPSERPTAEVLLELSSFCKVDPHYNFFDTQLAAKLRNANMMPGS